MEEEENKLEPFNLIHDRKTNLLDLQYAVATLYTVSIAREAFNTVAISNMLCSVLSQ